MPKIRQQLFVDDPYIGFDKNKYTLDTQGWGSDSPVFSSLILEIQPSVIIEVGTWKGGSAITMANSVKRNNIDCEIICIDTWSGAPEFWEDKSDPDRYRSLQLKNGYPSVYYQFLANMCHSSVEDVVTPLPLPSTNAAVVLNRKGIKADVIYIDGSHEYHDIFFDILTWLPLLKFGGVIFGDDHDQYWPSVVIGVKDVCNYLDVSYDVLENRFWIIRNTGNFHSELLSDFIKNNKERELHRTSVLKIAFDRLKKRLF
jgi:Methyltransferase domain